MKNLKAAITSTLLFGGTFIAACSMVGIQAGKLNDEKWSSLKLWYNKPAQQWTEALPVGNGRLGAMVFGGAETSKCNLMKIPSGQVILLTVTALVLTNI